MKPAISVYIIAFNEAEKVKDTIESVLWADEIILVDSHSTDGTVAIAEGLGARVVQVPFRGFGALRNEALKSCSHDWILSIDADERCTPEVRDEILSIIADPSAADVYFIPRRNFFMGKWIRFSGWYPNYRQPQLFRRGAMVYDELPVHEGYVLRTAKPPGHLRHAIWQFPFKDPGELLRKNQKYSNLGATKLVNRRVSFAGAFGHALWAFIKHFAFKLGFLDGWRGFVIAYSNSEGAYYKYLKALASQNAVSWSPPKQGPVDRRD
jgi:glycosyltransferase involved in cell wall biosynthesis